MNTTFKKVAAHRIKLDIETLPEGEIMISIAYAEWGPIVTGKTRKEAESRFLEALQVICISESIRNIVAIEEEKDYQKIKEMKEKMSSPKIVDSELVY